MSRRPPYHGRQVPKWESKEMRAGGCLNEQFGGKVRTTVMGGIKWHLEGTSIQAMEGKQRAYLPPI